MNKAILLVVGLLFAVSGIQNPVQPVEIYNPYEIQEEDFKNPYGDPFSVKSTAYCSCCECCGHSHGITKSGKKAKQGITIASNLYYGKTIIMYDENMNFMGFYECMDTGSDDLDGIDIFMDSHEDALEFGEKQLFIQVLDAVG